ncbi:putative small G-protein [Trypanosoma cruzi]|uniref:Uncharacterized protein n=2 Tax=Trypanosoma cruzi TaxID=5693 RepID=Q4CXG4_TRYCC|nr:hypothetical protein, conserved [Trypanosoma cruzi]EAN84963.1 hypothetical protein, conserved [Trypanosoma cruzi]RNC60776.1 putative small G-protein [Trypanosoma cruzi]|eukprot:XP_806814.1 hypothetical protein [Trypanosoma cruzi strain CL Brener]
MSFFTKVRAVFQKGNNSSPARSGRNGFTHGGLQRDSTCGGPNIWPVNSDVQRDIQEGSHLNMKAVVRGMRRTGKSTIVSRLCGCSPPTSYIPSSEITADTLFYRGTAGRTGNCGGGGAKVELWDVVDEGISTSQSASITTHPTLADARSIDVYRGCHLAAFVIDRTRKETLDYAVREARHVPPDTCVLFILNFYDAPRDAHVVSDGDVDAACKSIRRATTPMILAASAGRLPPEEYSISATWVSISAATGHGMELLRNAFEIPYSLLKVLTFEGRIHAYFQFVEEHRAWLLSERARLHLLEKEKQHGAQGKGKETPETAFRSLPGGGGDALQGGEVRGPPPLNVVSGVRAYHHVEEDENGIAKDFFNDIQEEEEGSDARAKRSSSGSSGGPGKRKAYPGEAVRPKASLTSPSPSDPKTKFAPPMSHLTPSTTKPLVAANSVPSPLVDGSMPQVHLLADDFREFPDDVLNVGDDQGLDVNFFGSCLSGEGSSHHVASVSTDKSDDEGDSILMNANAVPRAPLGITVEPVNEVSIPPDTLSIHADVKTLLQEMQKALGTSINEEDTPHMRHENRKGHFRRKKKDAKRNKGQHHPMGRVEGSPEVEDSIPDDGTFEVIQE